MEEKNKSLTLNNSDLPVWSIGFRPFFLGGAVASMLLILYWSISYFVGDLPSGYFNPIYWHAHEMIYGFVVSIIAGFLLTSSANWTQTKPLSGNKLKILFSLWLAGRLAMGFSLFTLPISPVVYSFIDMLFIPALAFSLAPSLIKSKKIKNLQFIPILCVLTLGNLLVHLSSLGVIDSKYTAKGIYLGLDLLLIILVVISGRVIPFFSSNTIKDLQPKTWQWVEWSVLISVWLYVLLDFSNFSLVKGYVAGICGVLNFIRLSGWKGFKTTAHPLLWILHLGYLWIVVGFFLVFTSEIFGTLPLSVAIHAFTAGAMGTFIIGMMSRVALGHTGRPLKLKKGFVVSYVLITFAAIVRIVLGFFPDIYSHGILCAGILWAAGYLLFIVYYAFILLTPRPDQ